MLWYILLALVPVVYMLFYHLGNRRKWEKREDGNAARHEERASLYPNTYKYQGEYQRRPFRYQWKYDSYNVPGLGAFFIAPLAAAVVFFTVGSLISTYGPLHREDHGTYPLVAMSDGSKQVGSYFLFSGYSDQHQTFSYYSKESNGGYTRGWQYANGSTIYQDAEPGTASLHQYYLVPNKWLGFTWLPHLRNEFHVPAGSIKENVTLDNEN